MPRLNKASLIGHIGNDPEFHTFQNGGRSATISIATDDSYRDDRTGERVKRTEWHRIVLFGQKLVDTVERLHRETTLKGSQVFIEGKLRTRSWEDQNKVKRYTTEIVTTSFEGFQLLGKKPNGNGDQGQAPDSVIPPDDAPVPSQEEDIPF